MKSNYKKLGQYIRQVDVRNTEGKEDNLLGVSVQKMFIPSIANTVGTDFTKYKVVKKGQFTYIPDTSRRGDKIGIALLTDYDEGLVSNVYTVFEVIDKHKLIPEYLMLWFSRPEFDRYARFKSHGSVREVMDWDEMCKVELPVPSYEKQKQIVDSYKTIIERIALKQKINDNLEEQANALYTLKVQEYCEMRSLGSFGTVITGKTPSTDIPEFYGDDVPFIKTPDMHGNVYITSSEKKLSTLGADSQISKYLPNNTVIVACIGANAGEVAITSFRSQTNQQINAIISKYPCFLYFSVKAHTTELRALGEGSSTMININKTSFESYEIPTLKDIELQLLEKELSKIFSLILSNLQEIDKLNEVKNILITRLSC